MTRKQPGHEQQAEDLAASFRRRLGTLDPRQVAIWREMTPARKLELLFQMWHLARTIAWTTERQWHPDLSDDEIARRVWKRMHGTDMPDDAATRLS